MGEFDEDEDIPDYCKEKITARPILELFEFSLLQGQLRSDQYYNSASIHDTLPHAVIRRMCHKVSTLKLWLHGFKAYFSNVICDEQCDHAKPYIQGRKSRVPKLHVRAISAIVTLASRSIEKTRNEFRGNAINGNREENAVRLENEHSVALRLLHHTYRHCFKLNLQFVSKH